MGADRAKGSSAQRHLQEQARDGDSPAVEGGALLIHHLRSRAESMIRAIPGRTCTSTEEPVLPADRHVCRQFDRQLPGGLGRLLLAPNEAGMARAEHRCEGDGPHLASSLDAPRLRPRVEDCRYAPSENGIDVHHPADSRPCAARRGGKHIMWEGSRRLPGASDCVVFGGTPPAYACTLYAGDAEESADGAYDRAVTGVKDCLQAGWKTTENVDGVHARITTAAGATGPSIRVVSRDVSGDAYLVELWVDGTRR